MQRILILLCLISCGQLLPAQTGGPTVSLDGLTFQAPADWRAVAVTSAMRKAHWQIEQGGQIADVAFFDFGKDQGGTVNENIQRWLSQFSDSAEKGEAAQVEVHGLTIHFVRSEGTFSSGMPGGPTTPLPDQALRGAILETPAGLIFIKMTGPKSLVEGQEKSFVLLITAAAQNGKS